MRLVLFVVMIMLAAIPAAAERVLTFDDLYAIDRLGDPQISPDGKWVAYVVRDFDKADNSSTSDIWIVSIKTGETRRFTTSEANDTHPRWSPDGSRIAFISTRDGSPQIWMLPTTGGEALQITDISTGAGGVKWSPTGTHLAFTSDVYADCETDSCNKARDDERAESEIRARIIDDLLYRHWNHWRENKWSHLFVVPSEGGEPRDLTPGARDCPPISLGGGDDYDFSPDGSEICYCLNPDPVVAISTNNDLFVMPVIGGPARSVTDNTANDHSPAYSPDGRYIAYVAMERAGFEADRRQIMLYDRRTGERKSLTADFDRSMRNFVWAPDGSKLYFSAVDQGRANIYSVSVKNSEVKELVRGGYITNVRVSSNGKNLVYCHQAMDHPVDIYMATSSGKKVRPLTRHNEETLENVVMKHVEEFSFEGAEGDRVHGLLLKPPFFDPGKKYAMIFLIHGGPQGSWDDDFHYRWNAQMFAAPGYVVSMINFRGSTGYGQDFTDAISGDWGGGCYIDLMKGLDYLLETYDFIDDDRVGAAGASYGGYMVCWIAGHTDRFQCLMNHDGVYNLTSMYGATEELWFPEWEMEGTPWTNPDLYKKWSAHTYAANFRTPMLIVHGENDFRVPVEQALECFTAHRRQGVRARLLYFPDEDHFVRKPQNAELWWKTMYEWFGEYLKD
ncbi:MAG: S9 family peptidase [Candidatus Eisenbacteria sp.]|nr:S9 family peptidase [Candidatus Eisenbacteria bacterium]